MPYKLCYYNVLAESRETGGYEKKIRLFFKGNDARSDPFLATNCDLSFYKTHLSVLQQARRTMARRMNGNILFLSSLYV